MIHDVDVLAREWSDPHALADHELARVLDPPAPWERIVVLGDSIAEGLREPVPGYRDLSWADRLAAGLRFARPGALLFNLGMRNLVAAEIRATQLAAARSLRPDLVVVTAGGNDTLRSPFEPEALAAELRAIVGPLRETGADVLTMDLFDTTHNPHIEARHAAGAAERIDALVAVTRAISAEAGAWHAQLREHPMAAEPGIYASDGLHLNARGHAYVADGLARRLAAARSEVPAGVR